MQAAKGTLYVVATPIGNLGDITLRALEVLKNADLIAAEDTRNTAKLLSHHAIATKTIALHEHNERAAGAKVLALLASGKSVALVSDAGTPAISDPGSLLVSEAMQAGFPVVPVPGANAAIAALSVSGMSGGGFFFYGFLPPKETARKKELASLRNFSRPLVFYEAPHRILELVKDIQEILGAERELAIAREITKRFETIHRATAGDMLPWLMEDPMRQKGEFVVIVEGCKESDETNDAATRTLHLLLAALPLAQAVKVAAEITGEKRNRLYELALKTKGEEK